MNLVIWFCMFISRMFVKDLIFFFLIWWCFDVVASIWRIESWNNDVKGVRRRVRSLHEWHMQLCEGNLRIDRERCAVMVADSLIKIENWRWRRVGHNRGSMAQQQSSRLNRLLTLLDSILCFLLPCFTIYTGFDLLTGKKS